jgi:hypothetical protein
MILKLAILAESNDTSVQISPLSLFPSVGWFTSVCCKTMFTHQLVIFLIGHTPFILLICLQLYVTHIPYYLFNVGNISTKLQRPFHPLPPASPAHRQARDTIRWASHLAYARQSHSTDRRHRCRPFLRQCQYHPHHIPQAPGHTKLLIAICGGRVNGVLKVCAIRLQWDRCLLWPARET